VVGVGNKKECHQATNIIDELLCISNPHTFLLLLLENNKQASKQAIANGSIKSKERYSFNVPKRCMMLLLPLQLPIGYRHSRVWRSKKWKAKTHSYHKPCRILRIMFAAAAAVSIRPKAPKSMQAMK